VPNQNEELGHQNKKLKQTPQSNNINTTSSEQEFHLPRSAKIKLLPQTTAPKDENKNIVQLPQSNNINTTSNEQEFHLPRSAKIKLLPQTTTPKDENKNIVQSKQQQTSHAPEYHNQYGFQNVPNLSISNTQNLSQKANSKGPTHLVPVNFCANQYVYPQGYYPLQNIQLGPQSMNQFIFPREQLTYQQNSFQQPQHFLLQPSYQSTIVPQQNLNMPSIQYDPQQYMQQQRNYSPCLFNSQINQPTVNPHHFSLGRQNK
jgi:hypothetical protein